MAYVNEQTSLPLSLDVQVSVTKLATLGRTNLSNICVVGEDLGFLPDANRVRIYSSLSSVETDFANTTDVYKAASFFFAQSPRPSQMLIGEAFMDAQSGMVVSTVFSSADLTALALITAGSMTISVDGVAYNLTAMDFSGIATIDDVDGVIQAKLTSGSVPATCSIKTLPGGTKRLIIKSNSTGATSLVTHPIAYSSGTFAGTALKLTAATGGSALAGYTPTNIASELENIQNAANAASEFIYGWVFGATFRDVAIQTVAATWALANTAMMGLVTNDVNAYDVAYTTDLGSVIKPTLNKRVITMFSSTLGDYPEMSILAYMLSVNYQVQNSTVTAKFKTLPGVTPSPLNSSQWAVLESKGYNIYALTGLNAQVYREGTTEDLSTPWFMDTVINMDNFVEDLSVNLYNVFLRNGKVPYTTRGQMLMVDACRDTGNQYVYNGTFADRIQTDATQKSGVATVPAVAIVPTPISSVSAATRASRIAPPISMVVQEAGAIHSIAVTVQLVS